MLLGSGIYCQPLLLQHFSLPIVPRYSTLAENAVVEVTYCFAVSFLEPEGSTSDSRIYYDVTVGLGASLACASIADATKHCGDEMGVHGYPDPLAFMEEL